MNRFDNVVFGQKAFVINNEKQILIIKRKETEVFSGFWDVPGGKLEDSDTLFGAISREIAEESGLELADVLLCLSSRKFYGDFNDKPLIFRNIYLCTAHGKVKLSQEHSEYKWVKPKELIKYRFPDDEDLQYVIANMPTIITNLDIKNPSVRIF